MKILILGHARHGKDHLAEYWSEHYGLKYKSTSMAVAELFMFDELKEEQGYNTAQECYDDRVNHRDKWFNKITEYNKEDGARLVKEIMKENDCYVGLRNMQEVYECMRQNIFDIIVWVDASKRLPTEPETSFKLNQLIADITIDNNDSIDVFEARARNVGNMIFKK